MRNPEFPAPRPGMTRADYLSVLREIEDERRQRRRVIWRQVLDVVLFVSVLLLTSFVVMDRTSVATARLCMEDLAWCEGLAK